MYSKSEVKWVIVKEHKVMASKVVGQGMWSKVMKGVESGWVMVGEVSKKGEWGIKEAVKDDGRESDGKLKTVLHSRMCCHPRRSFGSFDRSVMTQLVKENTKVLG
jgi:hypothetical protein